MERTFFAVTFTDPAEPVEIRVFFVKGRGSVLPVGASWTGPDTWVRPPTSESVNDEMERSYREGKRKPLRWREVTLAELEALVATVGRKYRDAWEDDGHALQHKMEKAREIHRGYLRQARAEKFTVLDTAYLKADEAGDVQEKKRVAELKARLRDLPADPAIDAAETVEQLHAFWPPELA